MSKCWIGSVVVSVAAFLAGDAMGQNALDANPRVGSGGRNTAGTARTYGGNANLIISGNATGGFSFRGYSPITSSSTFGLGSLSLPSDALYAYRRDSVGVSDLGNAVTGYRRPGEIGLARPYYSSSTTVLNAGQIGWGLNQPGSSVPASPYVLLAKPVDGRITAQAFRQPWQLRPGQIYDTRRLQPGQQPGSAASADMEQADENAIPDYGSTARFEWRPGERSGDLQQPDAATGLGFGLAPTVPGDGVLPSPWPPAIDQAGLAEELAMYADRRGRIARNEAISGLATQGEDAYADMISAVRFAEEVNESLTAAMRESAVREAADAQTQQQRRADLDKEAKRRMATDPRLAQDDLTVSQRMMVERQIQREVRREWAGAAISGRVTTFAGTKDTVLNRNIRLAEGLMAEGKYQLAVSRYDIARVVDPDNPLPLLGKGHALIATGEYRSAFVAMMRGIERFTEIARFQLDLPTLVGNSKILDVRRADLERRLADHEDAEFRFLLGYIEYFSGLTKFGIANLQRAARQQPDNAAMIGFVRQLAALTETQGQ